MIIAVRRHFLFLSALVISCSLLGQPVISSFSPASGPVGTTVIISGNNFSTTPANNVVYFGAVRANVTTSTATSLTVVVPVGATYQPITVSVNNLTVYSVLPFIVTFSGASPQFTSQSFEYSARIDSVNSGIETTKYSIGDIDNDNRIDVVTVDNLNNTMSVYRNTTTGGIISFAAKIDFTTGQSPRSVSVGDIDGDGKLDVVVSNLNDNTVSVFRNSSAGSAISFAAKVDFVTATQPSGIAIADIDKDGKPDLVVNTVNTEGYVSVLRNTGTAGNISFAPKIDLQSVGGSIEEIRTADIDGDGKADIILPNFSANAITIFRNISSPGNISFAPKVNIGTGSLPAQIEIGDLNDDGKPDMAVSYYLPGTIVSVYKNTSSSGSISFDNSVNYSIGSNTDDIVINDLDGDGKPDMAVNNGITTLFLFKNISSSGSNILFSSAVSLMLGGDSPMLTGDFDNDGKPDMAFTYGILRVAICKNRTTYPQVNSFVPTQAGTGTTITISGANFIGTTGVSFGGIPAASFTVVNSSTISAVVGNGASGAISVTAPYGSGQLNGFVFAGPPVIFSFSPASAMTGDTVTIIGQNFNQATAVSFGGVAAASFIIVAPNIIRAVVGSGTSGSVSIITSYGTGSLPGFTYLSIPLISSFNPTSAATGSVVVITGINFSSVTAVSFGGVPASSFTIINPTTINAVVGNGASGNIVVTNSFGSDSLPDFSYIPPPIISSFTPVSAGTGTIVTISGTNFINATSVRFGGTNASSFNIVSATTITAVVDLGSSGNVSVTSPSGTGILAGFVFTPPPKISSFSPVSGPVGTMVTISGSNFSDIAANNIVYFGSVKGQVTSASANSLTVLVPVSASYHRITVTVNNLTAFSEKPFIVTFSGGNSIFTATSFSPSISFPGGIAAPFIVNSDDLDGDGKPDAIFPDSYSNSIVILRNTSTSGLISFAPKINIATAWNAYYLATADFNGDGKKDIAVTNGNARVISVFINTSSVGSISFADRIDIPTDTDCFGIIAEDINGDGRIDFIIWRGNSTISIFLNKSANIGTLAFSNVFDFSVTYINASSLPMRFLDLDGDGKPEMIFAHPSSATIDVYRNTSAGEIVSFSTKVEFPSGTANTSLALGDLDGDERPDIVTNSTTSSVSILKNQSTVGNISFAQKIDFGTEIYPEDVNIADIDGDGKPDIALVPTPPLVAPPPPRIAYVLKNNSTPGNILFSRSPDYTISADYTAHVLSVLDDFNSDGRIDIGSSYNGFSVIANQVGGPGIAFFNPSTASTGSIVTITGNDFTGTTGVSFGGVAAASYIVLNSTTINAVVGIGGSGSVSVTTSKGTATLTGFTFIPPPAILSFTPTSAATGVSVTITGTNFTGTTTVTFGGTPASSFTVVNAATITAVVGTGASGNVSVTTPGGSATLAGFTYNTVTAIGGPNNSNTKDLLASPNPSDGEVLIKHPSSPKKTTIRFVDILGREVKVITPARNSSQTSTSVKGMEAGIYQIIWSDGKKILTRTFMVK